MDIQSVQIVTPVEPSENLGTAMELFSLELFSMEVSSHGVI